MAPGEVDVTVGVILLTTPAGGVRMVEVDCGGAPGR